MFLSDIISYAIGSIQRRKVRKGLALLGVTIGIAAIISLGSLSQGFRGIVAMQFEQGFSSDTIILTTGSLDFLNTESDFELYVNDTELIDQIDNVSLSVALIQKNCFVHLGDEELLLPVIGVDFSRYKELFPNTFLTQSGSISDFPTNNTVILGKRVIDPWNNGTLLGTISDEINITFTTRDGFNVENKTYTGNIEGILDEIGGSTIGGPTDMGIYIPISHAIKFFDTTRCETILVKLVESNEQTIKSTSDSIEDLFAGQVQVVTPTSIINAISEIVTTIELFLIGVSAISLVVAGVGIMNIMLTSIMERTREIGILKSIGMKKEVVILIFLSEALIIGILGSIFGIIVGGFLAIAVDEFGLLTGLASGTKETFIGEVSISPIFNSGLLIGSVIFGLIVSIIFGLYPAWRAAKLDPVEALRYE